MLADKKDLVFLKKIIQLKFLGNCVKVQIKIRFYIKLGKHCECSIFTAYMK